MRSTGRLTDHRVPITAAAPACRHPLARPIASSGRLTKSVIAVWHADATTSRACGRRGCRAVRLASVAPARPSEGANPTAVPGHSARDKPDERRVRSSILCASASRSARNCALVAAVPTRTRLCRGPRTIAAISSSSALAYGRSPFGLAIPTSDGVLAGASRSVSREPAAASVTADGAYRTSNSSSRQRRCPSTS